MNIYFLTFVKNNIIMTLIVCYLQRSVIFNYLYYIQGSLQKEWKYIWINLLIIIKINKNGFIKVEYSNNRNWFFVYQYQSYIAWIYKSLFVWIVIKVRNILIKISSWHQSCMYQLQYFLSSINSRWIKSLLMQNVCFNQWKTIKNKCLITN